MLVPDCVCEIKRTKEVRVPGSHRLEHCSAFTAIFYQGRIYLGTLTRTNSLLLECPLSHTLNVQT